MQVEDLQARMLRQLQRHKKTLNIRQHKKSLLFKPIQEQESPIAITQLLKKKKQQTLSHEVVQVVLERVDLEADSEMIAVAEVEAVRQERDVMVNESVCLLSVQNLTQPARKDRQLR